MPESTYKESQTVLVALPATTKQKLLNRFARITQFLTWPVLFLFFHLFFDLRIRGRENFSKVRSPFIIVANHVAVYDSFLLRLALGVFTPHLPLRFMAVKKFDWQFLNFLLAIGVVDFVYALFGVFTIVQGEGIEKGTQEACDIVRRGGNVVVYPEGSIIHANTVGPFKKGAAVIAIRTGAPVVPVSFRLGIKFLLRPTLSVSVGEMISAPVDLSVDDATAKFHAEVSGLYNRES